MSTTCSRTSATAPMAHALVRRGSQYDFSLSWCADFHTALETRDSFIDDDDGFMIPLVPALVLKKKLSVVKKPPTNCRVTIFERAAFYMGLKSKVGLVAAKASALRINLNIQGCSVVAPPLHAPSHSRAPFLLPLLLLHNIPLPRVL